MSRAIGCGAMRVLSRIAPLLALLLSVGALGGCGDESNSTDAKNTYVGQVNAAVNQFATKVTNVAKSITKDSSTRQDRRTIKRFRAAIKDVVGTLETINVPGDVRKEHGMLVAAMTTFGRNVADAEKAMRRQTVSAVDAGQRELGAATITVNQRIRAATDAINTRLRAK
jgi:hypothetical protein